MPKDKKDLATESAETIDKIEELLTGLLSFGGRYLTTIWRYLRDPSLSAKISRGELPQKTILFPLSFLTSSLFLFSLCYFRVLKELLGFNWISDEFRKTVTHIVDYHDQIAKSAFALQIAETLLLVVPLVLFVALFAKINELISVLVKKRTTMDQQMSASGYLFGTVASMLALWSLPFLYFIANYKDSQTTSYLEQAIGGAIILLAMGSIIVALYRYLQVGKDQYFSSWSLSCLVFVVASALHFLSMQIIVKFLFIGAA